MSAYCNHCGTALPPAARFCSACGTVVNGVPPTGSSAYGQGYGQGYAPGYGPGFPAYPQRLVRPIFGRQFAGVCAGMARTYGWDLGTVRILTVLGGVFLCPIVEIAYLACWIGIPEEQPGEMPVNQTLNQTPNQAAAQPSQNPPQS